ncbi:PDZ domain-containing protein [Acinetobacter sp. ANC 5579]|uniref:PDZ domain-containing protein n=1 Tax=Acinetobacter TaxID=469 RepID=UPI0015D2AC36|nr:MULTISPECIES: PDZ domain-containing protein [Acinetobacter]MCL6236306.1 PDZ domain-containing protein [Acinetobacter amyesii]
MKKFLLVFCLILSNSIVYGYTMYTYKDKNGEVFITNRLSTNSNVTLLKVNEYSSDSDQKKMTSTLSNGKYTNSSRSDGVLFRNNVEKFYKPADLGLVDRSNFKYLKLGEEVNIQETRNVPETTSLLAENSFQILGSSNFKDRNLSHSNLSSQAKKIGATHVVFTKINSSINSYTTQDDPNNLDFIYDYSVGFFVKNDISKSPDLLGVTISSIPLDKRGLYQRNTGVYIAMLVKQSRAYYANVLIGDVIVSINGKETLDPENFIKVKDLELTKNKIITLEILRSVNNELKNFKIPIEFQ